MDFSPVFSMSKSSSEKLEKQSTARRHFISEKDTADEEKGRNEGHSSLFLTVLGTQTEGRDEAIGKRGKVTHSSHVVLKIS